MGEHLIRSRHHFQDFMSEGWPVHVTEINVQYQCTFISFYKQQAYVKASIATK